MKALAQALGIADRVTFTGLVDPAQVPAICRRAMILALPNPASAISTHFTSPLKLFEYMAAGRAIVASDLPSIREVLRDDEHALLVEPGDADALAAAIRRCSPIARSPNDWHVRRTREAPEYTWARRAERLEALFDESSPAA